jgi:hypothetical protein
MAALPDQLCEKRDQESLDGKEKSIEASLRFIHPKKNSGTYFIGWKENQHTVFYWMEKKKDCNLTWVY